MPHAFKEVVVVRQGDSNGDRMVLRLTTQKESVIHAVAVPQDWPSRTGPTWTYVFENDGLTLIDAGARGSYRHLEDGLEFAGLHVSDIERVIITHGHSDHDGAAEQLNIEANADIWAHSIYAYLLPFHPWQVQRRDSSPLHQEMNSVAEANIGQRDAGRYRERNQGYLEGRKGLKVQHGIEANERVGNLTFLHAPGHSPDEICVTLDDVVFTGDHVLPEITPHPTTKIEYTNEVRQSLPLKYHQEDRFYGLATYLRSLKTVTDLGAHMGVLPAHRLYNRNRFNFQGVRRAGEVIQHHSLRLSQVVQRIGAEPTSLEEITRVIFDRRKLIGGNLYMALSEMVAHIELLVDTDDLEITDDNKLRRTGSENYRQLIHELTS